MNTHQVFDEGWILGILLAILTKENCLIAALEGLMRHIRALLWPLEAL
jgi:hypothetical protein